ncbi:PAS domain-containing sensor histidine kinase [Opitutus sp. ER46]|uniref:ATP-binding protein n=1 Tax=Opitutus sp. ER46 TaxID=2161864 RepID=UPI000D305326|nr:PAS domain-containing sensor histidine kinase [Opitutus sp. ER46]PTX94430.1 histidine kinase [Opitutus sp. ER46]
MSPLSPPAAARPDRAAAAPLLHALLATIPELVYFKDRDSRFIAVSASLVRAFGCASAAEVIGRTDADFYAAAHAQAARADEEAILRTGCPLRRKIEQEHWPTGRVTWALTSKYPLHNHAGEIVGTFGLSRDITRKREMEQELEQTQRDLVEASRVAGMAEVATGVLHNVGNVLSSLNVSASVITSGLRHSKADSLTRLAALLREHRADLGAFLSQDAKGRRIPEYLASVARHSLEERDRLLREIASLQKNIDHIKEIVAMQQAYATMIGVVEPLEPAGLVEDALRMNADPLARHEIAVRRDFAAVPAVSAEKGKVVQILVNLVRNAQLACDEARTTGKEITVRLRAAGGRVQLSVIDNGVGIPAANLTRIFQHGFTTRARGHGFGLHSSANAAREMKGTLTVHSDGPGTGATFTLDLPVALSR